MANFYAQLTICKKPRKSKNDTRFEKRKNARKPMERERIVYLRGDTIIDALNITKKIRYGKLNYLKHITLEEYLEGIKKQ